MKRYIVLAGDFYYPAGGAYDFSDDFEDLKNAKASAIDGRDDWSHILDTHTGEVHEINREGEWEIKPIGDLWS